MTFRSVAWIVDKWFLSSLCPCPRPGFRHTYLLAYMDLEFFHAIFHVKHIMNVWISTIGKYWYISFLDWSLNWEGLSTWVQEEVVTSFMEEYCKNSYATSKRILPHCEFLLLSSTGCAPQPPSLHSSLQTLVTTVLYSSQFRIASFQSRFYLVP